MNFRPLLLACLLGFVGPVWAAPAAYFAAGIADRQIELLGDRERAPGFDLLAGLNFGMLGIAAEYSRTATIHHGFAVIPVYPPNVAIPAVVIATGPNTLRVSSDVLSVLMTGCARLGSRFVLEVGAGPAWHLTRITSNQLTSPPVVVGSGSSPAPAPLYSERECELGFKVCSGLGVALNERWSGMVGLAYSSAPAARGFTFFAPAEIGRKRIEILSLQVGLRFAPSAARGAKP